MNLRIAHGIFTIQHGNMKMFHWKLKGPEFDTYHELADSYAKRIRNDIDYLAESAIRIGLNPASHDEAIKETGIEVLSSNLDYTTDKAPDIINMIFTSILLTLRKLLDTKEMTEADNVGIKSQLESMYDYYDKEKRYINARREPKEEVVTEASIEDSYIYKTFNASNQSLEKIVKYIKTSSKLGKEYFEDKYIQLRKSNISPIATKVIDAFDKGEIEILYSRDVKVGTSFPFIIRKNENGKIVASILIGSFTKITQNDDIDINMKQLYGLMESAYIGYKIQTEPSVFVRDISLMKITRDVYLQMILKIFMKEYSLAIDKELFDKVSYCISKFYLERIWMYPSKELIESYSINELKNVTDADIQFLKIAYDDANITDIEKLISFLSTIAPRMKDLNIRFFIEKYIYMYHGSALLSMDYLPYIFFIISNAIMGTFLINQPVIGTVIKDTKNIGRFYPQLARII